MPPVSEWERLKTLEVQMRQLEYADRDKETRIRSIEQTIWKAFGAMAAIQVIAFVVIELVKR